jgi:outer membrane protein insertion porin family
MIKFSRYIPLALLLAMLVIATSCSNTRYLADDESLYIGSKVQVLDSAVAGTDKKTLEKQLEEAVRPKPNSSFLGIRFKLTLYNLAGVPKKEKGLRNWLRNKIGEPPVLGTDVSVDANNNVLENVLQNQGFLRAESVGIKETKNKKTKAIFEVTAGPRLKIKELLYEPSDTSVIAGHIRSTNEKSLVKAGDYYNLDAIKDERIRIDNVLKNMGYYYFSPDYILMDVDTGIGNSEADVVVKLKYNEMPRTADKQYVINKVTNFAQLSLKPYFG